MATAAKRPPARIHQDSDATLAAFKRGRLLMNQDHNLLVGALAMQADGVARNFD
jgi:hypothetical protein